MYFRASCIVEDSGGYAVEIDVFTFYIKRICPGIVRATLEQRLSRKNPKVLISRIRDNFFPRSIEFFDGFNSHLSRLKWERPLNSIVKPQEQSVGFENDS